MRYRKCLLYICFIVLSTLTFYLLFDNQYIFETLQNFFQASPPSCNTNDHSEGNTSSIEFKSTQPLFQSHIPDYYPRLPIHIYTQNLTSIPNTTKLILLANGFFGDANWGLSSIGKSSTDLMTQLSCPYLANYCNITNDKNIFSQADAVVFHMRDDFNQKQARRKRCPKQRFVFALWESPTYTPNLQSYKNFFNWTMTYRFKSHIITSYYSANAYLHTSSNYYNFTMKENSRKNGNFNFKKSPHRLSDEMLGMKKLGTVAALISNCGGQSRRLLFIKRLQRYIDIKVYGRCGQLCPENIDCRDFIAKNYYFFLSFENSFCTDYTTEKFFSTLEYPIVPVVYGRTNYSDLIPSSGFIDANQFSTLTSLAQYLNQTRYDKENYLGYFSWKKDYVWGISQFFMPFCDLCLRLHLDSTPNVIDDMHGWWNNDACQNPRNLKS